MKKRTAKRSKRKGKLSPLDVLQLSLEHYNGLAQAELKLGVLGSREKIDGYLKLAREAAEAMAPYCHARLSPKDAPPEPRRFSVGVSRKPMTIDEWEKTFCSPPKQEELKEDAKHLDELLERAKGATLN